MPSSRDEDHASSGEIVLTLGASAAVPVFDAAPAGEVLEHLTSHLRASAPDPGQVGTGSLRFYDAAGAELVLAVGADGRTLALRRTDVRRSTASLQEQVDAVVTSRLRRLAESVGEQPPALPLVLDGGWTEQRNTLYARTIEWLGDPDQHRGGFFHNLFVHGGRV